VERVVDLRHLAAGSIVLMATVACGGSGGGPASPASAPPDESRGSFTLQGAGYDNVAHNLSAAGGNLIFCRREPPLPNTIWIRLATSPAANGEASPHVDIDLCNFAGTSTYTALHDTSGDRTCNQGPTAAVWWHDGGREFATVPASGPCTVNVTRGTTTIEGTFDCRGLQPRNGTGEALDVRSGSFRCNF
jgi:hypothetical protein